MFRYGYLLLIGAVACGEVKGGTAADGSVTGPQTLTVTTTGAGSVTSAPAGITCGTACSAPFDAGATVTLTATPDASAAFAGWSGDCAGTGPCTVTMDGAKSVTATFGAHGSARWVNQVGFSGFDDIRKTIVAPNGDVIIAGVIDDGATDLYVARYAAATGAEVWKKRFTTETGEYAGGVATDADGNVYLAGTVSFGSATFGTTTVTGDLFGNIVLLRLAAATGDVVWVKQWGGSGQDRPSALAVSGDAVYMAGETSSSPATFDALSISGSTNNGFIARAALSDGHATAVKLIAGNVDLRDVAVNGTDVAFVGDTRNTFTIDANCNVNVSSAGTDALIFDVDATTLGCRWARSYGSFTSNINSDINAVAAVPGGGWAFTGSFQGDILFAGSGSSLASHGDYDVFAVRVSDAGAHVWSFRYGDTGFDLGEGIAVTADGSVVLGGWFATSVTLGATTLTGKSNSFVTRMSPGPTPTHQWAVSLGGDDVDSLASLAVGADGAVYAVAGFTGMTTVGTKALTSTGDYDIWIAALLP